MKNNIIDYFKDALEDLIYEIALEVYEKHDEIYREASECLLDDDHEQVDMNVTDIIKDMIKEKLNAK